MDKKIVKVVYDNGEEILIESEKIKSREQIQEALPIGEKQYWRVNRAYERQFKELERDILWNLEDDFVREYAKDHLDLKDEDENDCDCKDNDISDYDDSELMAELSSRNLFGFTNVSIVSIDLFTRFSRIITFADNQELEPIISELEKKYNL